MSWLTRISPDKLLHVVAGVILFAIGNLLGYGLIAACIGGIAKEVYDRYHADKHTPDITDCLATVLGGCLGWICTI